MKRGFCILFLFSLFLEGCLGLRHLPKDKKLLNTIEVTGTKETSSDELLAVSHLETNRKFVFVFRPYLALHQWGAGMDSLKKNGKERKLHRWLMNKAGESPAFFDSSRAEDARKKIQKYLFQHGYFHNHVEYEVKEKKKAANLVYRVEENEAFHFGTIDSSTFEDVEDYWIKHIMLDNLKRSLLKTGAQYDENTLSAERDRIQTFMKELGYYFFPKSAVTYQIDTLDGREYIADVKVSIKGTYSLYVVKEIYVRIYNSPDEVLRDTVYYDDKYYVSVVPNKRMFNYKIFDDKMHVDKGELYNLQDAVKEQKKLEEFGAFKYVAMRFEPDTSKNGLIMFIDLIPQKRHNFITRLEASQKELSPGVGASITYMNPNLLKGAQRLEIKTSGSAEIFSREADSSLVFFRRGEYELSGKFTVPRFLTPWGLMYLSFFHPYSTIFAGTLFESRETYSRNKFNLYFNYYWLNSEISKSNLYALDIASVNSKKSDAFNEEVDAIADLRTKFLLLKDFEPTITFSSRYIFELNSYVPGIAKKGVYFNVSGEVGGLWIPWLIDKFFDDTIPNQIHLNGTLNYSRFVKASFDFRYYYPFNKHSMIVGRFAAGYSHPIQWGKYSVSEIPFDKRFYLGGSNSMRGWPSRQLGPGTVHDAVSFADQGGEIMFETNLEYRMDLISYLKLGVFVDVGNVWYGGQSTLDKAAEFRFNNLYPAISAGIGFRFDATFLVIRFDPAYKIFNPARLYSGDAWEVKNFTWSHFLSNIQPNIGVSYPF